MPHAPSSQRYGPRRRASRSAPLSISSDSDNDEEPPSKVRRTVAPHSPSFPSAVFPQTDLNGTKASPIVVADNGMAESKPPSQTEIGVAPTPRAIFLRDLLKLALDLAPSDVSRRHIYLLCLQAAGHGHRGDVDGAAHAAAWVFDQIHQQPDYPRESNTCVISITTPNAASAFTSWPNSWMQLQYRDAYFLLAREALKQEFPQFAPSYIEFILLYKGSLYLAMLALKEHIQQKALLPTWERLDFDPFRLGFLPSLLPGSDGVFLHQERHAAKQLNRASMKQPSLHGTTDQAQLVEDDSMDGEVECSCCCTDTSSSRAIHCSGDQSHFFCQDCVRSYVDNEIGNARCRPICFAVGFECRASISDQQLRRCLLPATLDLILEQQLNDDMKQMSNLVFAECPFCNYKEEVDAAFENRWFTCKNTKCMVVSCRSCLEVAHIPKSCEEVRAERKNSTRDQKLGQRHIMEEAMTEALMRKCNQCKTPFVKVDGCNKMTCPRQTCRNVQCYICSENIKDYFHFKSTTCPLHEPQNVEVRHQQEVDAAEKAAIAKIREQNPSISTEDLQIRVSNEIQKMEATTQQAQRQRLVPNREAQGLGMLPDFQNRFHFFGNMVDAHRNEQRRRLEDFQRANLEDQQRLAALLSERRRAADAALNAAFQNYSQERAAPHTMGRAQWDEERQILDRANQDDKRRLAAILDGDRPGEDLRRAPVIVPALTNAASHARIGTGQVAPPQPQTSGSETQTSAKRVTSNHQTDETLQGASKSTRGYATKKVSPEHEAEDIVQQQRRRR